MLIVLYLSVFMLNMEKINDWRGSSIELKFSNGESYPCSQVNVLLEWTKSEVPIRGFSHQSNSQIINIVCEFYTQ